VIRDMTEGKPGKILLTFALPMILGNVFQQLYNIVDSVVVGNFVGADALAAVGAAYPVTFLFIAIAVGGSTGCSVVISQLFGAGHLGDMKTAIYTALISIGGLALALMGVGLAVCGPLLRLLNTPANIMADARAYLNIYFLGALFLFSYNTLTAVFNALGDSKTPLYLLMLASVLNIGLDLLFVVRFAWGVSGVAWATLIAQGVSAVLSLFILMRRVAAIRTGERHSAYDWRMLGRMGRIAGPSILQQSIVSLGILFVQALVNRFGSVVVAGYTAATKIDAIAMAPLLNISNAMSTFTAQNVGAGKPERVRHGYLAALGMMAAIAVAVTGVLYLFGAQFVGLFVDAGVSQGVIDVGVQYLRVVSVFYVVMGLMFTTNGLLRGSGDMGFFMTSTLSNFTTRVTAAYALAGILGPSAIWWAIPMGWTVGSTISVSRFLSGRWKNHGVVARKKGESDATES
jgi:putative MATE family efflux protein